MNRRTRMLLALSKRLPHPEPPGASYLRAVRFEPPRTPLSAALLGGPPRTVRVADYRLPVGPGLRARAYSPRPDGTARPLVVVFHGGGFVMGNLGSTDWLCGRLAAEAGTVVVSVAYRMAPEFPAPVPFTDCQDATVWLLEHADRFGADPRRSVLLGMSAGGNLAALVALALRDRWRADPEAARPVLQVLLYPALDLTLASPSVTELPDAPILTRAIMDWYGRRYLPQGLPDSITHDDPRVSPLFAPDHTDLPPALLVAAGQDPLRDDVERYAAVLRTAGVPATALLYPEAVHGFLSMPWLQPDARPAADQVVAAVRAATA